MELRNYLLAEIKPKVFYKDILDVESGHVVCPFHEDTNPSLHIKDDGSSYCYGCRKGWKNILDFYMAYKEVALGIALYHLYNQFIAPLVSKKIYTAMYLNLSIDTKPYKWLLKRGIGRKTISRFMVGYDANTDRVSLPIFNEWGYCANIRLFRYRKDDSAKIVSYKKGMGRARLFPLTSLYHKEVYLFEGEMDTLLAIHLGLNSITSTGGSKSWRREFTEYFKDKIVYICYDNDSAGQEGSRMVAKELQRVASKVYNVILPKDLGKDFTDFMINRPLEAFLDIVSSTRSVTPKDLAHVKRLRGQEDYGQQETMIVELKPNKRVLHIILKIEEDE